MIIYVVIVIFMQYSAFLKGVDNYSLLTLHATCFFEYCILQCNDHYRANQHQREKAG